jgi:hypothetical protein
MRSGVDDPQRKYVFDNMVEDMALCRMNAVFWRCYIVESAGVIRPKDIIIW